MPRPLPSLPSEAVVAVLPYLNHFFNNHVEHLQIKNFGSGEILQLPLNTKVNFALLPESFEACGYLYLKRELHTILNGSDYSLKMNLTMKRFLYST